MNEFRGVWGEIEEDDDSKKEIKSDGFKSDGDENAFPDMLDEEEIETTLN